ncbi:MAG: peptidoglycan-binding protein [Planctomycetes bacterium]|nr:peptidoglycan-binding protein [Planctomycetota bacterium]
MSFVSRLVRSASYSNLLNVRLVEVFFQTSPGRDRDEGIGGLEYQVLSGGAVVQSGSTGDNGRIPVPVAGGTPSELQLMSGGTAVARYSIGIRDDAWEANNTILGVQRRLRLLGYHLGHDGDDHDGIDGAIGSKTDKAIQDFQIDQALAFDSLVGDDTKSNLDLAVGGST